MKTMLKTKISTKKLIAVALVVFAAGSIVFGLALISRQSQPLNMFADGGTIMIFAHQDDDLIWMLPIGQYTSKFIYVAFPSNQHYQEIVDKISANYYSPYKSRWEHPMGYESDFALYISKWITPGTERKNITVESIKSKIRPYIADPNTKRIMTHNNWGEYGHIHHRMINQAVRELAKEYGKDVGCLSIKVPWKNGSPDMDQYVNTGSFGLASVDLSFDHTMFKNIKNIYQQKEKELIAMNKWAVTDIWSWGDGEYQYPSGTRKFIKIVDKGNDLTIGNAAIKRIVDEIPIYGR